MGRIWFLEWLVIAVKVVQPWKPLKKRGNFDELCIFFAKFCNMCSIMFNDVQFVFRLQSIVAYCRLYNKMYYIYTYNMYIYCKYITPYHTSIYIHVCINFSCPATVTVIRSSPQEHQQLSAGDRTAPGRCEGKRRGAPKDQRGAYRQLQMHDVFVSRFYAWILHGDGFSCWVSSFGFVRWRVYDGNRWYVCKKHLNISMTIQEYMYMVRAL